MNKIMIGQLAFHAKNPDTLVVNRRALGNNWQRSTSITSNSRKACGKTKPLTQVSTQRNPRVQFAKTICLNYRGFSAPRFAFGNPLI